MGWRAALFPGLLGLALIATSAKAAVRDPASSDTPVAGHAALRGPQPAAAKPATPTRPKPLPVAFVPQYASLIPPDAGQCRLGCDQAYYFCLANPDQDDCGSTWASCRTGCTNPRPTP